MKKSGWIYAVVAFGLLGSIYSLWSYLTSSPRYQTVQFNSSHKECYSGGAQVRWKYCIWSSPNGTNGDIAYLFHGRNLDENTWNDKDYYTGLVQKHWERKKIIPPRIISVSFGPVWLLTPKTDHPNSGLLEIFLNEVMPEIEKKVGKPKSRIVFGESMGGLNALILGLKSGGLFKRVLSLCPGIYNGSPFANFGEIKKFLDRTGAEPRALWGVMSFARQYIRNEREWKSISPIDLLDTVEPKKAPEIYLSCGLYDKYGNFEGAEIFSEKAQSKGIKILWRPLYGGHCSIDVASVAEQLTIEQ